jgi:phage terminase large subunit-like protein
LPLEEQRIRFMRDFCGVELYGWQKDLVRQFGGAIRPRVGYVQVARKNGKSMLAAALALSEMCLLPERHVYAISDSERNLNSVLIREIRQLVSRSEALSGAVHVFKWGLECPGQQSFIEVRPGNFRASQGINPHLVLFDEVHLQRSDEIWSGMQMAGAARPDALLFGITTPGYDLTGLAHQLYQSVKNGGEGIEGKIYEPADEASLDDEIAWRAANPCFDQPGFLESLRFDRSTLPEHEFRRFRMGQWTETDVAWLPYGAWEARADPSRRVLPGEEIVLGFDGSFSGDATALVGATLDGHIFVIGAWENPGTPGWRVPILEVHAKVDEIFRTYRVIAMGGDPYRWQRDLAEWAEKYGAHRVVEWNTGTPTKMVPGCAQFYDSVMNENLTHDGNLSLAKHISNAVVKTDHSGPRITKDHKDSPRKIDLAVAAIIALDLAIRNRRGGSVYETRGMVSV